LVVEAPRSLANSGSTGMASPQSGASIRGNRVRQVFVHPAAHMCAVDAPRPTRAVRVELDGVVLAQSASPVVVFETGLPTRYYPEPQRSPFRAPAGRRDDNRLRL
jgi:hypothetical protein